MISLRRIIIAIFASKGVLTGWQYAHWLWRDRKQYRKRY